MIKQLLILGWAFAVTIRHHMCNGIQRSTVDYSYLLWFFKRNRRRGADASARYWIIECCIGNGDSSWSGYSEQVEFPRF
ncbi:hypothetical protein L3X38_008581 [Prunus dulcis]|uniref:Secreted protein n=1 Tax=Prunus dulcis TaxID=3755 RepID=A0AAD4ZX69_PRUDU|nr:hypothetical protein L3X38_008581 [Prunus dulcis]